MGIYFFLEDSKQKMDKIMFAKIKTERWQINTLEELRLIMAQSVILERKYSDFTEELNNIIRRAKSLSYRILNDNNPDYTDSVQLNKQKRKG